MVRVMANMLKFGKFCKLKYHFTQGMTGCFLYSKGLNLVSGYHVLFNLN